MISRDLRKGNSMTSRYQIGQKVIITPVENQHLSQRDSGLEQYAGQIGEVADYHWISPNTANETFYIYTIRIGSSHKEVVLHEDELEACLE
jgi:hypothetical protein